MENIKKSNILILSIALAVLAIANLYSLFLGKMISIDYLSPGRWSANRVSSVSYLLGTLAVFGVVNRRRWATGVAFVAGLLMLGLGVLKLLFLVQHGISGNTSDGNAQSTAFLWETFVTREVALQNIWSFLVLGSIFVILGAWRGHLHRIWEYAAVLSALGGMFSMIGYLYQAPAFYSLPSFDPMSFVSGFSVFILSFAVLFTQYEQGIFSVFFLNNEGSKMARYLLPLIIIVPILTGLLHLFAEKDTLSSNNIGAAVLTSINILIFIGVIWNYSIYLNKANGRLMEEIAQRSALEERLLRTNIDLEKKVEQRSSQIMEAERRFSNMTHHSSDIIFICDERSMITFVSPAIEGILGFTVAEVTGLPFTNLMHANSRHEAEALQVLVMEQPKVAHLAQLMAMHRNGYGVWLEGTMNNLVSDSSINGIMANFHDVTSRKMTEDALLESEVKYRNLFYNNPACVIIWYLDDLSIAEINHSVVQTYGYTHAEFLRLKVLNLRPPEDHHLIREFAAEMLADTSFRTVNRNWRHRHKNGHDIFFQISSQKIEYNGRPAVISIQLNETEKMLLERSLEEEKDRKVKEITSAVILAQEKEREEIGRELHDNVNPLIVSSRLYLGLAKNNDNKKEDFLAETDKIMNMAIDAVRQLSHSLVKPRLSKDEFEGSIVNLVSLFEKTSEMQVSLVMDELGSMSENEEFLLCMYRIFQEQMNNILKYSEARNVAISIRTHDHAIVLRIADDGKGFDTSIRTHGVGLLNIQTRASLMDGRVNVTSSPGHGCELIVEFPYPDVV